MFILTWLDHSPFIRLIFNSMVVKKARGLLRVKMAITYCASLGGKFLSRVARYILPVDCTSYIGKAHNLPMPRNQCGNVFSYQDH